MHPTSHLLIHEQEAYQALFGLHGAPVGQRLSPIMAADLESLAQPLACLLVELPIREAGGQLPGWEALEALKAAARARALPLHLDGARLWESRAFYGRTHAQIVDGFASVYVSTYKGLAASPARSWPAKRTSSPRRASGGGAWAARSFTRAP